MLGNGKITLDEGNNALVVSISYFFIIESDHFCHFISRVYNVTHLLFIRHNSNNNISICEVLKYLILLDLLCKMKFVNLNI